MLLRAGWVLPVSSPPIRDGAVRIEKGLIAEAGPAAGIVGNGRADREFPEGILLPGFVNAHAHLELHDLQGRLPPGGPFVDWVRRVIEHKSAWSDADLQRFAAQGAGTLAAQGITCVGDHATRGLSYGPLRDAGLRGVVFLEFVEFSSGRTEAKLREITGLLQAFPDTERLRMGLAPHAPYSVSPALLKAAGALARREYRPLSIHLAEVMEEVRFLADGSGPFRGLLTQRGIWDEGWKPPGQSPVAYARSQGILGPATVAAHLNYPQDGDLILLRESGAHAAYCPNSHAFFGHPSHPLPEYLEAGIPCALGTDSLASNGELSMLAELRRAWEKLPDLTAARLLILATRGGAEALGLGDRIGTLAPGKEADLIAVRGPADAEADPLEHLVRAAPPVLLTMVGGTVVYEALSPSSTGSP